MLNETVLIEIVFFALIGVALAIWVILAFWSWKVSQAESGSYMLMAALSIFLLVSSGQLLVGSTFVIPLRVGLIMLLTVVVPPLLTLRAWRRFRALIR